MARYWTSDLHIGHVNLIEHHWRPFATIDEQTETIVENWNSVVTPDDTVMVLGDVVMGNRRDNLRVIDRLNGTKILVPGNHDYCSPMVKDNWQDWAQVYLDAGFVWIVPIPAEPTYVGDYRVNINHFPYGDLDHSDDARFMEYRPVDDGQWLLHGHLHGYYGQLHHGRQIDVGLDVWDFTPVADGALIALMDNFESNLTA